MESFVEDGLLGQLVVNIMRGWLLVGGVLRCNSVLDVFVIRVNNGTSTKRTRSKRHQWSRNPSLFIETKHLLVSNSDILSEEILLTEQTDLRAAGVCILDKLLFNYITFTSLF